MNARLSALLRFVLVSAAEGIGAERPEAGYALQAALAERDDARLGAEIAGLWDEEAGRVGRSFDRRATTAFMRPDGPWQSIFLASAVLGEDQADPRQAGALAAFALQGLARESALKPAASALKRAADAAMAGRREAALTALDHPALRTAPADLAPILRGIAYLLDGRASGEVVERMELPRYRRSTPPPGFDFDRGRQSRADLVLAVLRAHDVQLRDVERGRIRPMTRDDLAEAILRDPFWDDIDASVQEDGVVEGILRDGKPSPAIDGTAFGQPHVYIKRIVR